jgi:hypothetical protein
VCRSFFGNKSCGRKPSGKLQIATRKERGRGRKMEKGRERERGSNLREMGENRRSTSS